MALAAVNNNRSRNNKSLLHAGISKTVLLISHLSPFLFLVPPNSSKWQFTKWALTQVSVETNLTLFRGFPRPITRDVSNGALVWGTTELGHFSRTTKGTGRTSILCGATTPQKEVRCDVYGAQYGHTIFSHKGGCLFGGLLPHEYYSCARTTIGECPTKKTRAYYSAFFLLACSIFFLLPKGGSLLCEASRYNIFSRGEQTSISLTINQCCGGRRPTQTPKDN